MACTPPLREALTDSISSGRLVDTRIVLYSRRDSSGAITKPRALYANSHVLKTVPYFSDLLSGTYSESEPRDFSEPIDEDEQAVNYDYYSDSDLEDDDDVVHATGKALKKAVPPKGNTLDPFCSLADEKKPAQAYGEWNESSGKGIIIKVHDIALITFQAFLMYLYTDEIEFAPYGSEENRRSRSAEIVSPSEDSIPRPSPKSIYRLAHMYDMPTLQELALGSIRNGLERCDTVEEVFNEFSSKYEAVRTMHINHLISVLSRADDNSAGPLHEKIDEKVDCYASGDLDYASDAIAQLWKLTKAGEWSPPPDESCPLIHPVSPANWVRVEVALIKSIRKGIFFDRKYWARHSKTKTALRPVYISSIVASEKLRHIDSLVKVYQKDKRPDAGEGTEDSDCEGTPDSVYTSSPEAQVDEEEEKGAASIPVLTLGSFASWRSLFFYMCTDDIQFAHLKSQIVDVDAQPLEEQVKVPDRPLLRHPPCSPKAIYSLATALEIKALRDLAFDDIQSKVTDANIVTELFSSYASRNSQDDIAKMECGLLYDKFDNETTTEKGVKLIESMIGGRSAHRSGVLKLGLRRLSGAFLRCSNSGCDLRNNSTSYHSLGSSVMCPRGHSKAPYLECSGCGTSRSSSDGTSLLCQGCKKRFK